MGRSHLMAQEKCQVTRPAVRPFFIVGVHRSGTTLLRYMLSSHSRLYVPQESDFIPAFFLRQPERELSDQQIAQILDTIFEKYRFVEEWQGTRPDTSDFLQSMSERTPAALLDALYTAYARQNGAQRWGDKTPIYASYIDLIHQIFPEAQFVHIIRDGRDAALSMLAKYQKDEFHVDIFFAARNWVRRIRKAQASGARLGSDLYYELRYEDLVADPEQELKAICDFLGESFEGPMLRHHRLASARIPSDTHFFDTVRHPTTGDRIGRWRSGLSRADQRLVQAVAGSLLEELNYPLEDLGPMPPSERLRLAALAVKYFTLQAGRWVLQRANLFPPI
jgi:hypothetical protein